MTDKEKEAIKNLTEYAYAIYDYVLKAEDAKAILNLIEKQQAELEKKDKIIDMLLDKIAFNCNINSYEDIKTIKQQIKEEIERKVENGN